ncbi:SAM-dependent methyltransferase, partial [Enterococcus italicus]|uniref:N-6 DNA methylase n=1 Tax=Enterococcus italicus TaxID=246144 RepID=UPI002074A972
LKTTGEARAAVVVPDNVLFADGIGEQIRKDLLNKCNLHTILRLPTGIFYAQGVQTNVLFFTRGITEKDNTKETWIYDMRSNARSFGKRNPLNEKDFAEFIECYHVNDLSKRTATYSAENPNGRWRNYSIEEIQKRANTSLDIFWMEEEKEGPENSVSEILDLMEQKSVAIADSVAKLQALLGDVAE